MNTFTLAFLHQSLVDRNAFIYHGAGIAKGVGNESTNSLPFLDRLRNAISMDLEICCSVVKEGDSETTRNFWGKIGVIIWPKSKDSVTLVCPRDAGTAPDPQNLGRRSIARMPITSQALINSIDNRSPTEANEWCLLDYEVVGIFIEPPIQYQENNQINEINITQVFIEFPGMKVYAFCYGKLRELCPPGQWGTSVTINQLYPYTTGA